MLLSKAHSRRSISTRKLQLLLTPVLTYAGGETAFDKVQVLQGEKVQGNNKVITYTGGEFTYTSAIPYKEAMKMSEFVLRTNATSGKKSLDFDPIKLADGVIATSTLVAKACQSNLHERQLCSDNP